MAYRFNLERAITKVMRRYGIVRPTAAQWNFVLSRVNVPRLHRNSTNLNLDRLELLMHEYVYSAYLHEQFISIHGFCLLADIARETLYGWVRGKSRKDCKQALRVVAMLKEERNLSIQNGLDTPSRCLGALAVLRHECSWTTESVEDFADMHGLICTDPQSVKDRYRAVADSENA